MNKFSLLSGLLICVCLTSCKSTPIDTSSAESIPTTQDTTPSSEDTSTDISEEEQIERNWTEEQIELFNQHLEGYILPSLPYPPTIMRYFLGDIVADYEYVPQLEETFVELFTKDGFTLRSTGDFYIAQKFLNDNDYIYVSFVNEEDGGQLCAHIEQVEKEREHKWDEQEKQIFKDHLQNVVLPFPDTGHVSVRYTNYSSDNYVHITGDYSETILSSYLSAVETEGFVLSKHKVYGIDVAIKQLTNNKYIELWVAIADETAGGGGRFFEILGRVHQGTLSVIDDKHISLGTYPQSEVKPGESIYKTLLGQFGDEPTLDNPKSWSIFSDHYASYEKQNTGFYQDIEFDGNKYRAIYSLEPRTVSVAQPVHDTEFYYQVERNGYYKNIVYIFKYEPVIWEIMANNSGVKTLAPTSILDMNYFSVSEEPYELDGKMIYPSNYEHSFIRGWLNTEFYNTIFSSSDKAKIQTTLVDNSEEQCALSEGEDIDQELTLADDYHDYLSPTTEDKVYLFSRKETLEYDFGYPSALAWGSQIDVEKAAKPATEYAAARGSLISSTLAKEEHCRAMNYYFRTPNLPSNFGNSTQISSFQHGLLYSANPSWTNLGVFPGINVII